LGRVKVELFPLEVGVLFEPTAVPPVQGVAGALSWHRVQLTAPVGGPPVALPATVAVSPHVPPMAELAGGRIAVVKPGAAGATVKHSPDALPE
jgi:hypothetical protein